MNVWIVKRSWEYEYDDVIGVFSTQEKAEEYAAAVRERIGTMYENVDVTPWTLDEADELPIGYAEQTTTMSSDEAPLSFLNAFGGTLIFVEGPDR